MNNRKSIDYTDMYEALDTAMAKNLSQVELYWKIGKAICQRTEKGAAVAAATYLSEHYPGLQGFSPRNLRRMRDFYRVYENHPALLAVALQIGWTQNVVILEADLPMELREWYLKAVRRFMWSKIELLRKIISKAHEEIILVIGEEECNEGNAEKRREPVRNAVKYILRVSCCIYLQDRCRDKPKREAEWRHMMCLLFFGQKRIVYMRC